MPDEPVPDEVARRVAVTTLVVCCTALFMTTLDNTILNVALPSLQRELHAPTSGLQWTVDAYVLTRAGVLFSCGAIGDRYGRLRLFRLGLVVFTLGSAACGAAPNLDLLIAFRVLQALGGSLMTPSSLAIIANTFTERRARAKAIGVWSATTGLSTAAGPIIGGALLQGFDWRSVFWVNIPVGIIAMFGTRLLRESRAETYRRLDIVGQLMIALALGSLTYGLIEAPTIGWLSWETGLLAALTVGFGAAFLMWQRRSDHPLLNLDDFRDPALSAAVVIAVVAFIALGGFIFYNTLYLQEVRHYTPLAAGLLTMPVTLANLGLAPLAGRMTAGRGPRLPATLACGCMAAAMAVLAVVISPTAGLPVLLFAYLLLGCGQGLVNPPLTNAAVSAMPSERAGVASATTSTARQIGTNLGVALVGSIVFSTDGRQTSGTGGVAASPAHAAGFTAGLSNGYLMVAVLAALCVGLSFRAFRRPHAA